MSDKPKQYSLAVTVNGHKVTTVLIGRHYLKKHNAYMNDALILQLVAALDGGTFAVDSASGGIEYYAADIERERASKIYRIIWLFEGERLEILGVINAYRRKKRSKK